MKWIPAITTLSLVAAMGCRTSKSDTDHEGHDHAGHEQPGAAVEAAPETAPAAAGAAAETVAQTVCPVSGEELGSMGDTITATHAGRTVQLCCKSCVKKFNADPEKYLAKLDDPDAAQEAADHDDHDH